VASVHPYKAGSTPSFLKNEVNVRSVDVLYGGAMTFKTLSFASMHRRWELVVITAALVAGQGILMRNFSGEFRFAAAAFRALAVWRERRVRVTVDGQVIADAPMNLIGVANGLYAGGGMMLSPDAGQTMASLTWLQLLVCREQTSLLSYREYIEVVTWAIRK
jgi:hypothetical protein